MGTRVVEVLWAISLVGVLALGWIAVMPIVGDVHAVSGGACGGVTDCNGQQRNSCPMGCTSGFFNSCTTGSYNPGICFPDGGQCDGMGCPVSCSCAGV